MNENEIIGVLFLDSSTTDGYLHQFIDRNHTGIFSSTIFVHIGTEQCLTLSRHDVRSQIFIPYPNSSEFNISNESDAMIFGYRIIEIMVVNDFVTAGKEYCFMFHNFDLYYIAATIIRRFNSKIILYQDRPFTNIASVNPGRNYLLESKQTPDELAHLKSGTLFLNYSHLILAKDSHTKIALMEVYGILDERVEVWSNCIWNNSSGGKQSLIMSELSAAEDKKIVFIYLQDEKSEHVVKLLSILRDVTKDVFVICGISLEEVPLSLRFAPNLKIIGKVNKKEISELASEADVLLFRKGNLPNFINLVDLLSKGVKCQYFDDLDMIAFHNMDIELPYFTELRQKEQLKTLIENTTKHEK
ncbi:hypothetical protein ACTJKN_07535 [Pedobacter sp. 22163]|uniref:hypothetical protein n=1 Tax=Pedobacter sp. 22163 TaxID=3453883 RepID=UPI003F83F19B